MPPKKERPAKPAGPRAIATRPRRQSPADDPEPPAPDSTRRAINNLRQQDQDAMQRFRASEERRRIAKKPLPPTPGDDDEEDEEEDDDGNDDGNEDDGQDDDEDDDQDDVQPRSRKSSGKSSKKQADPDPDEQEQDDAEEVTPKPKKNKGKGKAKAKAKKVDPNSVEERGDVEEGTSGTSGRRIRARDRPPPFVPPREEDDDEEEEAKAAKKKKAKARRRQAVNFDAERAQNVDEEIDDSAERDLTPRERRARNERAAAEIEQIGREQDGLVVRVDQETEVVSDEELTRRRKASKRASRQ